MHGAHHLVGAGALAMGLFGKKTEVELSLAAAEVVAGDPVRVSVTVGELDKKAQGARVELGYRNTYKEDSTDSDGDRTTRTSRTDVIVATKDLAAAGGQTPDGTDLELALPADAPGSAPEVIDWFVRAVVDRRRARDASAQEQLTVRAPAEPLEAWAQSPPEADGPCAFELEASTRTVRPGERLTGMLTVAANEDISARAVRMHLVRRRDDPDANVDTDDKTSVELCGATALRRGETHALPFEITVPADAPPSFRAEHNRQRWFLRGVVDVKRAKDPSVSLEVVVHTA